MKFQGCFKGTEPVFRLLFFNFPVSEPMEERFQANCFFDY